MAVTREQECGAKAADTGAKNEHPHDGRLCLIRLEPFPSQGVSNVKIITPSTNQIAA